MRVQAWEKTRTAANPYAKRDPSVRHVEPVAVQHPIGLTGRQRHLQMLARHDQALTEAVKGAGLYKAGDRGRSRKQWVMALRKAGIEIDVRSTYERRES